jgi:hypothetical protein
MGIGDWFKRFKRNAAGFEEYREGAGGEPSGESQAERAAHEGAQAPSASASPDQDRGGIDQAKS